MSDRSLMEKAPSFYLWDAGSTPTGRATTRTLRFCRPCRRIRTEVLHGQRAAEAAARCEATEALVACSGDPKEFAEDWSQDDKDRFMDALGEAFKWSHEERMKNPIYRRRHEDATPLAAAAHEAPTE